MNRLHALKHTSKQPKECWNTLRGTGALCSAGFASFTICMKNIEQYFWPETFCV